MPTTPADTVAFLCRQCEAIDEAESLASAGELYLDARVAFRAQGDQPSEAHHAFAAVLAAYEAAEARFGRPEPQPLVAFRPDHGTCR